MRICIIYFCLLVEMTRFTTSQEYARPSPTDMPYSQRDLINKKEKMKSYLKNLNSFKVLLPPELVKHGSNGSADLWVEDEKIRVPFSGQGVNQISKMNLDQGKLNRYLEILDLELAKTPATIQLDPSKIMSYVNVLNTIMKSNQLSKPVDLISRSRIKLMKSLMTDRSNYYERRGKKLHPKDETFFKKEYNQMLFANKKNDKNLENSNVPPAEHVINKESAINSDPEMLMMDEQRAEKLTSDLDFQNSGAFDSYDYEPDRNYLVNDFGENNNPAFESMPIFNNQLVDFKSKRHLEKNNNDFSENLHYNVLSTNDGSNEIKPLNKISISKHPDPPSSSISANGVENKDVFQNIENAVKQNYGNNLKNTIFYNGATNNEQIAINNQLGELKQPLSYANVSFSYPLAINAKENIKTHASMESSPADRVFSDDIYNLKEKTSYVSDKKENSVTNLRESIGSHELGVVENTMSRSLRQTKQSEGNTSLDTSKSTDQGHNGKLAPIMENTNLTNIEGNVKENGANTSGVISNAVGNNDPAFQNENYKQDLNHEPNSLQLVYTNMPDEDKANDTAQKSLPTKLMLPDTFISNPFNFMFSNSNDQVITTGCMNLSSLLLDTAAAGSIKSNAENTIFDAFNENIFHSSTDIIPNTPSSVNTFEIQPPCTHGLSKFNSDSNISPDNKVFPLQPNDEIMNVPKTKCFNNESSGIKDSHRFPTKPAKMYSNYYLSKLKKFEQYKGENDFQNLFDRPLMPLFGTKENEVSKILNVNLEHLHFDKGALYKIIGKALKIDDENREELAPPKWLENKYDELLHASHRGQTLNQDSFNDQDDKYPIYSKGVLLINNNKRSGEESVKSKQQILQNKGNMKIDNSNGDRRLGM